MSHEFATTCACKRQDCASVADPVCAPLLYAGHDKTGILFVRHRDDLQCPHLRSYSYGEFCMSSERIDDFLGGDPAATTTRYSSIRGLAATGFESRQ